jgi:hypothetical protein
MESVGEDYENLGEQVLWIGEGIIIWVSQGLGTYLVWIGEMGKLARAFIRDFSQLAHTQLILERSCG